MNRLPPDSITAKVRRIFGRGMLEGVRVAGIPNPEEFLMKETAAQLGFALAIRHWSTSTYHVHAIKPEVL